MGEIFSSPFTVAIAAMCIPIVAIISGVWAKVHSDRLKAEQRMAMLARGHSLAEIEAVLKPLPDPNAELYAKPVNNPVRSIARARRTAIILICVGLGNIAFGIALDMILHAPGVLCVAAAGLIPLIIGLGFIVDYILQKREITRFGLEIAPPTIDPPTNN